MALLSHPPCVRLRIMRWWLVMAHLIHSRSCGTARGLDWMLYTFGRIMLSVHEERREKISEERMFHAVIKVLSYRQKKWAIMCAKHIDKINWAIDRITSQRRHVQAHRAWSVHMWWSAMATWVDLCLVFIKYFFRIIVKTSSNWTICQAGHDFRILFSFRCD